jgi:hypothetical protein
MHVSRKEIDGCAGSCDIQGCWYVKGAIGLVRDANLGHQAPEDIDALNQYKASKSSIKLMHPKSIVFSALSATFSMLSFQGNR